MKSILNWFAGGFFRKLGNIFAYIILGLILSLLLSKLDINLFNIMKVKADTVGTYTSASYEVLQCEQGRVNCTSDSKAFNNGMGFGSTNGHIYRYQYLFYNSSDTWNNGMWTITLGTFKRPLYFLEEMVGYNFRFYANNRASSSGAVSGNDTAYISSYNCSLDDKGSTQDFYITCTFNVKTPIKFFMIELYTDETYVSNTDSLYWWGIEDFKGVTDSTSAINNQTIVIQNEFNETNQNINNVNDSINNLTDTLTDDDVSDDVDDGLDFFDDFDVGNLGTLTQIVLSPFQFLSQLIVGNNQDICFTLKGTTACLPNGQRMIWNKTLSACDDSYKFCPSSSGINAFKTFFNLVVGGYLAYKMLLSIFKAIHRALDPTENHIEVMKL